MLKLVGSFGRGAVTNLFPWRKGIEVPVVDFVSASREAVRELVSPECLGELERLVDDTLALFVISDFGVTLSQNQSSSARVTSKVNIQSAGSPCGEDGPRNHNPSKCDG